MKFSFGKASIYVAHYLSYIIARAAGQLIIGDWAVRCYQNLWFERFIGLGTLTKILQFYSTSSPTATPPSMPRTQRTLPAR